MVVGKGITHFKVLDATSKAGFLSGVEVYGEVWKCLYIGNEFPVKRYGAKEHACSA